jgi:hypothetical protein
VKKHLMVDSRYEVTNAIINNALALTQGTDLAIGNTTTSDAYWKIDWFSDTDGRRSRLRDSPLVIRRLSPIYLIH